MTLQSLCYVYYLFTFGIPSTLKKHFSLQKQSFLKMLSKVDPFENAVFVL